MPYHPFNENYTIRNGKVYLKGGLQLIDKGEDIPINKVLLSKADAATFKELPGPWAIDKNYVFCSGSIFRKGKLDRKTFQHLNAVFIRDAGTIYDWCGPIKRVDLQSFEVLDSGMVPKTRYIYSVSYTSYAKDKNGVYFRDNMTGQTVMTVRGADPSTIQSLGNEYARDANHVYCSGIRIKNANSRYWTYLGNHYSCDDQRFYYSNREIKDIDIKKFWALSTSGRNLATDGEHYFVNDSLTDKDKFIDNFTYASSIIQKQTHGVLKKEGIPLPELERPAKSTEEMYPLRHSKA